MVDSVTRVIPFLFPISPIVPLFPRSFPGLRRGYGSPTAARAAVFHPRRPGFRCAGGFGSGPDAPLSGFCPAFLPGGCPRILRLPAWTGLYRRRCGCAAAVRRCERRGVGPARFRAFRTGITGPVPHGGLVRPIDAQSGGIPVRVHFHPGLGTIRGSAVGDGMVAPCIVGPVDAGDFPADARPPLCCGCRARGPSPGIRSVRYPAVRPLQSGGIPVRVHPHPCLGTICGSAVGDGLVAPCIVGPVGAGELPADARPPLCCGCRARGPSPGIRSVRYPVVRPLQFVEIPARCRWARSFACRERGLTVGDGQGREHVTGAVRPGRSAGVTDHPLADQRMACPHERAFVDPRLAAERGIGAEERRRPPRIPAQPNQSEVEHRFGGGETDAAAQRPESLDKLSVAFHAERMLYFAGRGPRRMRYSSQLADIHRLRSSTLYLT